MSTTITIMNDQFKPAGVLIRYDGYDRSFWSYSGYVRNYLQDGFTWKATA